MHLERSYVYFSFCDGESEAQRLSILQEDALKFLSGHTALWGNWSNCPSWFDETNLSQAETVLAAAGFEHTPRDQGFSYTIAIVYCAGAQPPKVMYLLTEDGFKVL